MGVRVCVPPRRWERRQGGAPALLCRRGAVMPWSPSRPPRPPGAVSGSHQVLLSVGDQERNAFIAKSLLLLAGGPGAPALRGMDRRHRKNLLQESPQCRKDGEAF